MELTIYPELGGSLVSSAVGRVALLGCGLLALQPLLGKIPVLGWFLTMWPVTWGVWIYLASSLIREARPYLRSSENPRIPYMGWSALIGCASGLAGAIAGILLNTVLASVAAATGPAGSFAATGYAISASLGLFTLITKPFWGLLVCGTAGLLMGGTGPARDVG